MKINKIKAIVFDLDDTLYLEEKYIESGFLHISKVIEQLFGLPRQENFKIISMLFKESSMNVFNRFLDKKGIKYTKEDIKYLVDEYRNHIPQIDFCFDAVTAIRKLKEKGYKLGIITDGFEESQRKKLVSLDAYNKFDEIIITDELGKEYWKPHPRAFEMILEKFDIQPNEMIYVGDNPEKDFYIRSKFPIVTVRIMRKGIHKDKKYFRNIEEVFRISNLDEILIIVSNLNLLDSNPEK